MPQISAEAEGEAIVEVCSLPCSWKGCANFVDIHRSVLQEGNPFNRVCDRQTQGEWSSFRCKPRRRPDSDASIILNRGAHWKDRVREATEDRGRVVEESVLL